MSTARSTTSGPPRCYIVIVIITALTRHVDRSIQPFIPALLMPWLSL
jgi:hypothetical protein